MNTRRLYHSSKRRREVYLKKMSFLAATFVLVLCFSIIAVWRMLMMILRAPRMYKNILRVLRFSPAIPCGILPQNIQMAISSQSAVMSEN